MTSEWNHHKKNMKQLVQPKSPISLLIFWPCVDLKHCSISVICNILPWQHFFSLNSQTLLLNPSQSTTSQKTSQRTGDQKWYWRPLMGLWLNPMSPLDFQPRQLLPPPPLLAPQLPVPLQPLLSQHSIHQRWKTPLQLLCSFWTTPTTTVGPLSTEQVRVHNLCDNIVCTSKL